MKINNLFNQELFIVNVGVDIFYEACLVQDVSTVQVDFAPPAGGDERLIAILDKLRDL